MRRGTCCAAPLAVVGLLTAAALTACDGLDGVAVRERPLPDPEILRPRMGEQEHRKHVITHLLPEYPPGSIRRGSEGVAVASIVAGRDGRVESVELLQAPDEKIGQAVRTALEQWTFTPGRAPVEYYGEGVSIRIQSRMTFYFRIVDGAGVVLEPPAARPPLPAAIVRDLRGADLNGVFGSLEPVFVDIRDRDDYQRGHYPGSVNIPRSELEARAPRELPRERFVVVLCPRMTAAGWRFCTEMARRIANSIRERRRAAERGSGAMNRAKRVFAGVRWRYLVDIACILAAGALVFRVLGTDRWFDDGTAG